MSPDFLLLLCLKLMLQRNTTRMLRDEENLPTASKYCYQVAVLVILCGSSHIFFCAKNLVKAFGLVEFINKNNLSTVCDHTVAGIA